MGPNDDKHRLGPRYVFLCSYLVFLYSTNFIFIIYRFQLTFNDATTQPAHPHPPTEKDPLPPTTNPCREQLLAGTGDNEDNGMGNNERRTGDGDGEGRRDENDDDEPQRESMNDEPPPPQHTEPPSRATGL